MTLNGKLKPSRHYHVLHCLHVFILFCIEHVKDLNKNYYVTVISGVNAKYADHIKIYN